MSFKLPGGWERRAPQPEIHVPQALASEIYVMSVFIRDRRLFDRHPLDPAVFTEPGLVKIYHAMVAIGDTDPLMVGQYLANGKGMDAFTPGRMLSQLVSFEGSQAKFSRHLEILMDHYARRQTIKTYRLAIEKARDSADPSGLTHAISLLQSIEPGAPAPDPGFGLVPASEIESDQPARDFVEGLFTEGGAGVVYGESNVGKSFWVLDIAAHATSLSDLVKSAVEQSGQPCRLVIIDTLARAMAGGDENSSRDMTAAVATIDAVRASSGAHVCIVHHCGKDIARGARGHSSLRAAVDTEVEIFRPEGERISTVRVTKQRDLERGEPMPFSLTVVETGRDQRGKPITSCIVRHEHETTASKPKSLGRQASYSAEAMLEYLPAANGSKWAKRAKEDCGISSGRFYQLKAELRNRRAYQTDAASGRLVRTSIPIIPG